MVFWHASLYRLKIDFLATYGLLLVISGSHIPRFLDKNFGTSYQR